MAVVLLVEKGKKMEIAKEMKSAGWVGMGIAIALVVPSISADAPGKKIFDSKCALCHGNNGKGKAAMAKLFKVDASALDLASDGAANKNDEELLKIIADGKNKMPAYSKQLKAEELKAVVQHIRTLAPKKAEAKPAEKTAEPPAEKAVEAAPAKSEAKPVTEKAPSATGETKK